LNFGKARGTITNHFEAKKYFKSHVMEETKEVIEKPVRPKTEPIIEDSQPESVIDSDLQKIDDILASRRAQSIPVSSIDVAEVVLENLLKDVSEGASKIAKNIDLQYLYIKTKAMFPPDWSFETWILNLVSLQLYEWGIRVQVWQELDNLPDDKLESIRQAKIDWQDKTLKVEKND
jgi:hypothetical protein